MMRKSGRNKVAEEARRNCGWATLEWEKTFLWVVVLLSLGKESKEGVTFVFAIIQGGELFLQTDRKG